LAHREDSIFLNQTGHLDKDLAHHLALILVDHLVVTTKDQDHHLEIIKGDQDHHQVVTNLEATHNLEVIQDLQLTTLVLLHLTHLDQKVDLDPLD